MSAGNKIENEAVVTGRPPFSGVMILRELNLGKGKVEHSTSSVIHICWQNTELLKKGVNYH